jgi:2'-hydroxyisoflavone reductase
MQILILGGTRFLGKHLTFAALERGHSVTLFNRGKTNPHLFPEVEKLQGDRDGGLQSLDGRQWDAVIDVNGYVPRIVRASAEKLRDAVKHYTFISTISVYAQHNGNDESAPVATIPDETVEEITGETYGALKALCEQAVEATLLGRTLVIRPGLIVGPDDPTDRFTYWPVRVSRGGEVLAPDRPAAPAQYIDVRDLAAWTIRMVEQQATGIYNATGTPTTFGDLLNVCKTVTSSDATFTWVSETFLLEKEVQPWGELPMWIPQADEALNRTNVDKALKDGLTFRPTADTVRATLDWNATRGDEFPFRPALAPEKEAAVLEAWKAAAAHHS